MEAKHCLCTLIVDVPLWQVEGHLKFSWESVSLGVAAVEDLLASERLIEMQSDMYQSSY